MLDDFSDAWGKEEQDKANGTDQQDFISESFEYNSCSSLKDEKTCKDLKYLL